jgi:hypothetical protein
MVGGMDQHLNRIGLSRAALKTAILADIQGVEGLDDITEVIASAVADAIEANNEEILRQLRDLLAPEGLTAPFGARFSQTVTNLGS